MTITVEVDGKNISFIQGDTLDLGADGVILWLSEAESKAYRHIADERAKKVRETIQYNREKALNVFLEDGEEGLRRFSKGS